MFYRRKFDVISQLRYKYPVCVMRVNIKCRKQNRESTKGYSRWKVE